MPVMDFIFCQPLRSGLTDDGYLNKKTMLFEYQLFSA